ncbi:MAG: response regulator [Ketobacteraceae bacterium]|nr:response regulator [Ketobacteraceae bacterium]
MEKTVCLLATSNARRLYYKALLREFGFRVYTVSELENLRQVCESQPVEMVVVLGADRSELAESTLKLLRARSETLALPVVVISSILTENARQKLLIAGAVDVISADCSPLFLCERLSDILQNNQSFGLLAHHCMEPYEVLVLEDNLALHHVYQMILDTLNCHVTFAQDGIVGWDIIRERGQDIDLIITDIYMPNMNGLEFCMLVKNNVLYDSIPVIVVSSDCQEDTLITLLQAGVSDYITKPFGEAQLRARLQAHLRGCLYRREQQQLNGELVRLSASLEEKVRERTEQLRQASIDTIYKLAVACDYKDSNTANHIARVRHYVRELAMAMGCDKGFAEELGYSSMMHDVGKLGIPDEILRKPGPLNEQEWTIMKRHPEQGAQLLGDDPFYRHARDIALRHHEKYDGTGYPGGLKGEEIPFSARLVAAVDIYDALTSARAYKPAWGVEDALQELGSLKGRHLDPRVVDTLASLVRKGRADYIMEQWPSVAA